MLNISSTQMKALEAIARDQSLQNLCKAMMQTDPILTGGRSINELFKIADHADKVASSLQMKSIGAVALIMTIILATGGKAAETPGLRSIFGLLRNKSITEQERMADACQALFDLDNSLPPELQAASIPLIYTPELELE